MMKKILLSAAIAAALATPAFAQSYDPDYGSGNIDPPVASVQSRFAGGAFAYVPETTRSYRAMQAPGAVYSYGQYRGWDPDPNVRLQLRRDDLAY